MAIFGWIVLFLISVAATIAALAFASGEARLCGKVSLGSLCASAVALILWWITFSNMPFTLLAN